MKIRVVLATALALCVLSACGTDTKPSGGTPSSFLGTSPLAVVKGSLLQVDLAGKNARPASGTVVLTGPNGAEVTNEVGPTGAFEIRVYPGDYQVKGTSPQPDGGTAQCAAREPKTVVSADAETVVDVLCVVG